MTLKHHTEPIVNFQGVFVIDVSFTVNVRDAHTIFGNPYEFRILKQMDIHLLEPGIYLQINNEVNVRGLIMNHYI